MEEWSSDKMTKTSNTQQSTSFKTITWAMETILNSRVKFYAPDV